MTPALRMMIASVLMLSVVPCAASPGNDTVCAALLEDERTQMADYELDVERDRQGEKIERQVGEYAVAK